MLDKCIDGVYNAPVMTDKEYKEKYELFCHGLISEEEWHDFCFNVFLMVLDKNKKTLERLKYGHW